MPMMWGYNTNYGGMTLGMIVMSLFWLALAGLLIWGLIRLASRATRPTPTPDRSSALDILEARYARGEIDAATFSEMRAQLLQSTAGPVVPARPNR